MENPHNERLITICSYRLFRWQRQERNLGATNHEAEKLIGILHDTLIAKLLYLNQHNIKRAEEDCQHFSVKVSIYENNN